MWRLQHRIWPIAAFTAGSEARYTLRIAILLTPSAFDAPVSGVAVAVLPATGDLLLGAGYINTVTSLFTYLNQNRWHL